MKLQKFSENKIVWTISGVLFAMGITGFLLWLIQRVIEGKGTDLYKSHWGLSFSAIGILIFIGVAILVGFIGAYYSYHQSKEEKDLINKYGKGRDIE